MSVCQEYSRVFSRVLSPWTPALKTTKVEPTRRSIWALERGLAYVWSDWSAVLGSCDDGARRPPGPLEPVQLVPVSAQAQLMGRTGPCSISVHAQTCLELLQTPRTTALVPQACCLPGCPFPSSPRPSASTPLCSAAPPLPLPFWADSPSSGLLNGLMPMGV